MGGSRPTGRPNGLRHKPLVHPEHVRQKIKMWRLISLLHQCAFGKVELSMPRLRAIEILLRKCVPDLTATAVTADITHRFVMQLPDVLNKEEWVRKYGDPKQIEGSTNGKTDTLQ
jgi:hypothetical protein